MNTEIEFVDLVFPVVGSKLQANHSYHLFSAIAEQLPVTHEADWLGIHSIKGVRDGRGMIHLNEKAELRLRLPADKIAEVYKLAGKQLVVGGQRIAVGVPTIHSLQSSPTVWSRIVVIKPVGSTGNTVPDTFLESVKKSLAKLDITGTPRLEEAPAQTQRDQFARRIVKVKDVTITGYGVYVDDLSETDSMKLQSMGIGGRRKMGCGLFIPVSKN